MAVHPQHDELNNQKVQKMSSNEVMPGYLLRRGHQIAVAVSTEELAEFSLTPPQYSALLTVCEHPGIDITALSAKVAFDRSTLGGILDRLEEKDLIFRRALKSDKRMRLLYPTREGGQLIDATAAAAKRAQDRILAPLSVNERERLIRLLTKLVRLQAENVPASVRTVMERNGG